jgi:hypothetical protein
MIMFLILIFVFMAAFGTAIYVVVGRNVVYLSSTEYLIYSFISFMFGGLSFEDIYMTSPVLGPILYFGFLFMFNILLINLLIAVLSHKYEEIIADSKREYDLVFTDIVLEMREDAMPAPVNLLLPLRPIYRFTKSLGFIMYRRLRKPFRWATYERRECWAHLDYNPDMKPHQFFCSYFVPFTEFSRRTDIFAVRVYTIWVDILTSLLGIPIGLIYFILALIVGIVYWALIIFKIGMVLFIFLRILCFFLEL